MFIKSFIFILPTLLVFTEGKVARFFVFNGIQLSSAYFNSQEILIYITTNLNDRSLCNWQEFLSVYNPRRSAFLLAVLARGEGKEKKLITNYPLYWRLLLAFICYFTIQVKITYYYINGNFRVSQPLSILEMFYAQR